MRASRWRRRDANASGPDAYGDRTTMSGQRTILVTFAGRRDRMQLLTRYAAAAIDAGLIDEWHVWDFTRTVEDAQWLRQMFPDVQTTPSHTLEYFRCRRSFELV